MKKKTSTSIIFVVLALLCLSCVNQQYQTKIPQQDTLLHYTYDEINLYDDGVRAARVCKFEYSGHHYIQFSKGTRGGSVISVVHDPDCPCHQND
jgi:hypothetical protein